MHVWDSRRKRMGEEGQSILCQSWSSSAGGLGHGQSGRIWQLIVSQELPERHCHSERTQHNQNTKWHIERSTESFRVIPVFVCQRQTKKKRCEEACREALVITPSPDVTSSQKKRKKTQETPEEFYKSIKTSFGDQSLCQDSQRETDDFLSEAHSHDLWPQCFHLSTKLWTDMKLFTWRRDMACKNIIHELKQQNKKFLEENKWCSLVQKSL